MTTAGYAWDFSFLWAYRWLILTGLGVTIAYTIGTIISGAGDRARRPGCCDCRATG